MLSSLERRHTEANGPRGTTRYPEREKFERSEKELSPTCAMVQGVRMTHADQMTTVSRGATGREG